MHPVLYCLTILLNIPIGISFTFLVLFTFYEDKKLYFQDLFSGGRGGMGPIWDVFLK